MCIRIVFDLEDLTILRILSFSTTDNMTVDVNNDISIILQLIPLELPLHSFTPKLVHYGSSC